MSIDQFIAMSASIGACLSAIAAFLAVKQNTKQREASYRPELAITRTIFTASKNPLTKSSFADFWVEGQEEKESGDVNLLSSLSLPLRNIGLGAAKEVSLNWSFPIEALVSDINKKTQKSLIPAYFEYKNEVLSLKSDQLVAAISMWGNQKKETVDYVLPASTDQGGVNIHVPNAYMELVSALIYFSTKEEDRYSFPDMPVLKLDLEYFDIGGDKHKSSFKVELNLIAIHGYGEGFHGYMQSKKIA
ncbi:MAG: hypothetical protein ABSB19_15315 [Methylomonas sp.]